MSRWNKPDDPIQRLRQMGREVRRVATVDKYDSDDLPIAPDPVTVLITLREFNTTEIYRAIVTWPVASPNTCQADVDYWIVQMRAVHKNGVPIDTDNNGADYRRQIAINNKGADSFPHAIFDHLPHPTEWYYAFRVAIVDKAHRQGPFSPWTDPPLQPAKASRPQAPAPTGVNINYDPVENTRYHRNRALVIWDELPPWDVPGTRSAAITNATMPPTGNIATFVINTDLKIQVDDHVIVKGIRPIGTTGTYNTDSSGYNGSWKVLTVSPDGKTITANIGANIANMDTAFPAIMTDVVDHATDVKYYRIEFRRCNADGTIIGNGIPRKRTVAAKDDGDAGTTNNVAFEHAIRKAYYYQARVGSIDRFNREGKWSEWTAPATPSDTTPPALPIKVSAFGDIKSIGIQWDIPPDSTDPTMPDEDTAFFQVQVSLTPSFRLVIGRDNFIHAQSRRFKTNKYGTRYWLRVRSVDASGNVSAWVTRGSVSPVRAKAVKRSQNDIDFTNELGYALAGGRLNRGYITSTPSRNAIAVLDAGVGNYNGLVEATFTTSPTTDRTKAGIVIRGIDANNFLLIDFRKLSGTNGVFLRKMDAGVQSSLITGTGITLADNTDYNVQVILEDSIISVYVNGVLVIDAYTLTGGDATKYATATQYGFYVDAFLTGDDTGSRFGEFSYMNADGDDVLVDYFGRAASATSLGTSELGQVWTALLGVWGIADQKSQQGLFGNAVIRPWLYFYDNTARPNTFIPVANVQPIRFQVGAFTIDRPVKMMMDGFVDLANSTTPLVTVRVWFLLCYSIDNGVTWSNGTAATESYAPDNGRHQIVNFRQATITNASSTSPKRVLIAYGLKQTDLAAAKKMDIFACKIKIDMSYAPDVAAGSQIQWTSDSELQAAYRAVETDDVTP